MAPAVLFYPEAPATICWDFQSLFLSAYAGAHACEPKRTSACKRGLCPWGSIMGDILGQDGDTDKRLVHGCDE